MCRTEGCARRIQYKFFNNSQNNIIYVIGIIKLISKAVKQSVSAYSFHLAAPIVDTWSPQPLGADPRADVEVNYPVPHA